MEHTYDRLYTNALENDRPQHVLTACVIAQDYSSATFVATRFHSRNEKFGLFRKGFLVFCFFFLFLELG
jgi:hypothetical protein